MQDVRSEKIEPTEQAEATSDKEQPAPIEPQGSARLDMLRKRMDRNLTGNRKPSGAERAPMQSQLPLRPVGQIDAAGWRIGASSDARTMLSRDRYWLPTIRRGKGLAIPEAKIERTRRCTQHLTRRGGESRPWLAAAVTLPAVGALRAWQGSRQRLG